MFGNVLKHGFFELDIVKLGHLKDSNVAVHSVDSDISNALGVH